jgi:HSP20 family protein
MKTANPVIVKQGTEQNGLRVAPTSELPVFQALRSEMNRLFEDFGNGVITSQKGCVLTKLDIKDRGDAIIVTAEIPGVDLNDITLAATPHYISLSGEKRAQESEADQGYYRMEREYGYFRRVVHVPCEIDRDSIDAEFKNGVLTLVLPKTKSALAEGKKITVREG